MDNFIKKQNLPEINPSININTRESKPIVKEAIGNFFETFAASETKFSWKENIEAQILEIKSQTKDLAKILNASNKGASLNLMG